MVDDDSDDGSAEQLDSLGGIRLIQFANNRGTGSARKAGTLHWWKDTRRYLTQVVRLVLSYSPLRIFMPFAAILAVIGFTKLGFDWATRDYRLAANTLIILFAAFQMFAIGLLADLFLRLSKPSDAVEPASS